MTNATLKKSKSELLLPVANMNMCLAAIHNGADAIYVGMPEFNARGRTADLSISELKEIIETCHLYGVKVNLAFNVIIFEDELQQVIELLKQVLPLSPDALIVQDLGLACIIKAMAPDQVIHGSTQMTVTNYEAMDLLAELNIKRFVLGREVSMAEMQAIKNKSDKELEVFVHGALCVAYSGQCFTSESIGGRSANRGECAQSCRFEYDMLVDGSKIDLKDKRYLVSPKDLCGIEEIPKLLEIGIESFKVEGRLKTPEYVAAAAKNYRQAIDQKLNQNAVVLAKKEMGLTYSRGFYSGWLHGVNHQNLVDGTFGGHRGVEIGLVKKINDKSIVIETNTSLKKGDGVLFAKMVNGVKAEIGGKIYEIKNLDNREIELFFSREFAVKKVKKDFLTYLNHDDENKKRLEKTFTDKNLKKRIPLDLKVEAFIGNKLKLKACDGTNEVIIETKSIVEKSQNSPLSSRKIEEELAALSSSCFILNSFNFSGDQEIFLHQKELKELRRSMTEQLMSLRIKGSSPVIYPFDLPKTESSTDHTIKLNILLRDHQQVDDLISFYAQILDILGVVYLDFEFGRDYAPSVEKLRALKIKVGIATTRILKPNEYHNFKVIERANPDVILCRNLGAIQYFQKSAFEIRGDFSLNISNSVAYSFLANKNLSTLSASYDLNAKQLEQLIKKCNGNKLEITIHQYMPSFHMEHCVFAAFLSTGTSFKDCGKPCEKHRVELLDQFGNLHQIKADQECRNTMFNNKAFSFAPQITKFIKAGAREFRFEALYEKKNELKEQIISLKNLIQKPDFH